MTRNRGRRRSPRTNRGFTVIEIAIGIVVIGIMGISLFSMLVQTNQGERLGSTLAEAQQNARRAIDVILSDLRQSGYGVDRLTQLPIETASEFRITFVIDRDGDGEVGPGERVTYFLDDDDNDPIVNDTANPNDFVLRRIISTEEDSMAVPGSQKGFVVAYGITQNSDDPTRTTGGEEGGPAATMWNVRLFDFFDGDGNSLIGGGADPAGDVFGNTVPDSVLGSGGAASLLRAIRVDLVAEGTHREPGSDRFPEVRVTGTVNPRNLNLGERAGFLTLLNPPPGEEDPGGEEDGGGEEPPPGEEEEEEEVELPPYEPPIRIPTSRVLCLASADLNEIDWQEGSLVTSGDQHDWDIIAGTSPGGGNNVEIWFSGWPDRYPGNRLYNSYPNYFGATSREIGGLAAAQLNPLGDAYTDLVGAVAVSDNAGGFEVWMNQAAGHPGWVGTGASSTVPTKFYNEGSGAGRDVETADLDLDGDPDVVLGTRTGSNIGAIQVWENDGSGSFTHRTTLVASGEVNAVAVADFNGDGWPDLATGTKTNNNDKTGKVEVWINNQSFGFTRLGPWSSGGKVNALAAGSMDDDGTVDLVAGTKTGNSSGKVELWLNDGYGNLSKADEAAAEDVVLCVALGQIDYGNSSLDIVAGNEGETIQAWFCDPSAAQNNGIIPLYESWSDAYAGGVVHDLVIRKLEANQDDPSADVLNDIVAGTSINASSGEIVLYFNPYVWTLNNP